MAKIYMVRHQAVGVLTEFPFAQPPSPEQLDALARLCFQRNGATHPKTKEPYWLNVVELEMLGPGEIPSVPERDLSVASSASTAKFDVSAVGTVTPPKK